MLELNQRFDIPVRVLIGENHHLAVPKGRHVQRRLVFAFKVQTDDFEDLRKQTSSSDYRTSCRSERNPRAACISALLLICRADAPRTFNTLPRRGKQPVDRRPTTDIPLLTMVAACEVGIKVRDRYNCNRYDQHVPNLPLSDTEPSCWSERCPHRGHHPAWGCCTTAVSCPTWNSTSPSPSNSAFLLGDLRSPSFWPQSTRALC